MRYNNECAWLWLQTHSVIYLFPNQIFGNLWTCELIHWIAIQSDSWGGISLTSRDQNLLEIYLYDTRIVIHFILIINTYEHMHMNIKNIMSRNWCSGALHMRTMTQLSTVLFRTPVFTASDVHMVQERMIDVGYQVGSWDNGIGQNWASADSFFCWWKYTY